MIAATLSDSTLLTDILSASFQDNKSIQYLVKQDAKKETRIRQLMKYSINYCTEFGKLILSNNKKACALLVYPYKKTTSIRSVLLDLQLVVQVIGISNIRKAIAREREIKKMHPATPFAYLWFIGVDPAEQGKGIGSQLLHEIMAEAAETQLPLYLETSTEKNLPWYEKHGFRQYATLNFGYTLYFLRKSPNS